MQSTEGPAAAYRSGRQAGHLSAGWRGHAGSARGRAGRSARRRAADPPKTPRWPIHRPPPALAQQERDAHAARDRDQGDRSCWRRWPGGGKAGLFGGAGVGKTVLVTEADPHDGRDLQRHLRCSPASVERSREGHEMLLEMRRSGILDRTVLVYGQMNEPPGARWRVGLSALHYRRVFSGREEARRAPSDGQRLPLRPGGRRNSPNCWVGLPVSGGLPNRP